MATSNQSPLTANHLNTRINSTKHPLILRTVHQDDAPHHAALISGMDPDSPALTAARSAELITGQRKSADVPTVAGADGRAESGPTRVNMVVCLLEPGEGDGEGEDSKTKEVVIGLGGYGAIKDWERDGKHVRAGDVGVVLAPEYRGKGYATEAIKMAMDWGFSPISQGGPQMEIITITTLEDNMPMLGLAENKLGLKGRGVLRPAEFDKDKQEMYYEVTPDEWATFKKNARFISRQT